VGSREMDTATLPPLISDELLTTTRSVRKRLDLASRVGHYGPPDGWQMWHASRFIFGLTQLAVQFRWRGPCAQLASRLGRVIFWRGKCVP
jgi:hypothetical protein